MSGNVRRNPVEDRRKLTNFFSASLVRDKSPREVWLLAEATLEEVRSRYSGNTKVDEIMRVVIMNFERDLKLFLRNHPDR